MGLVIYNRDKDGNIDKSSTTYISSQQVVDEGIRQFLEGSELAKDLKSKEIKIDGLQSNTLSTQVALVEVYELLLSLQNPTK